MSYDSTVRDNLFERLGYYVRWWYQLNESKVELEDLRTEAIETFLDDQEKTDTDETLYGDITSEINQNITSVSELQDNLVTLVSGYLTQYAKEQLDIPYTSPKEIMEYLADKMESADPPDTVLANTPSVSSVEGDNDNSVTPNTLPSMSVTELARPNNHFKLTCIDDSLVNEESWSLQSDMLGEYGGEIVTGTETDWETAGIADLMITAAQAHDDQVNGASQDPNGKVSDWRFAGAVRRQHTDEDGRIYLQFNSQAQLAHTNDDMGQLSDWNLTGATLSFGEESDIDGKLHVSVVKSPSQISILGGGKAEIDEDSITLYESYFDGTTTDNGKLYVVVEKDNATYTISLYDNYARTGTPVATGSFTETDPVNDWPAEITLTGGGGQVGCLTLSSFGSDCSPEDDEDGTIVIEIPRYFVQLYRTEDREEEDLVSEGVSYLSEANDMALTPQGDFTTTGTVDLKYVQNNEGIELTLPFYLIDAYMADPSDSETTEDHIVARAGSVDNLLSGVAKDDLPFYPANESGLEGASVDISTSTVNANDVISAVLGFKADDTFTFETNSTDNGRFQTFMRDKFDVILPSASSDPAIPETLTNYPYESGGSVRETGVLYVDKRRTDSYTANGSISRPFKTVQAALDRATELFTPEFEWDKMYSSVSININPGRYNEDCSFIFQQRGQSLGIHGIGHIGEVRLSSLSIQASDTEITSFPASSFVMPSNELNLSRLRIGWEDWLDTKPTPLYLNTPNDTKMHAFCWETHLVSYQSETPVLHVQNDGGWLYAHLNSASWISRLAPAEVFTGNAPAVLVNNAYIDYNAGRIEDNATADLIQINSGNFDAQNSIFDAGNGRAMYITGDSQVVLSANKVLSTSNDAIQHDGTLSEGGFLMLDGVMFDLSTHQAVNAPNGAPVFVGLATWNGYMGGGADISSKITVADPASLKRLHTAAMADFTPAQESDWNSTPAETKAALDELASRVKASEVGGTNQETHVLYVDGQRTDSYTANGSISRPFKTVQAALDRATELLNLLLSPASFGVTVSVAAGHYNEDCAFTFPAAYRRLDIAASGGPGSVSLRSLEITPSAAAGNSSSANILNLQQLVFGNTTVSQSPLILHRGGYLRAYLWNCRIDLDGQDMPLCTIGEAEGSGSTYAHFYGKCRLMRTLVPAESTTPALECYGQNTFVDFDGFLHQDGGVGSVPLVKIGTGASFGAQDSAFEGADSLACFELAGSGQLMVIDSKIHAGTGKGVLHTGSFAGDGATIILDGDLFYLTTGQAIDAANGALVAIGVITWDGALAGYGDITSKITVADPALLKRQQTATITGFTPAQTSDWNTTPSETKAALDELASRVKALESA